jgi:hypothetical protein
MSKKMNLNAKEKEINLINRKPKPNQKELEINL